MRFSRTLFLLVPRVHRTLWPRCNHLIAPDSHERMIALCGAVSGRHHDSGT